SASRCRHHVAFPHSMRSTRRSTMHSSPRPEWQCRFSGGGSRRANDAMVSFAPAPTSRGKMNLVCRMAEDAVAERRRALRARPTPRAPAGVAASKRERELALAADPRKRENYERFLRARRDASVDYLPVKLDIENVSRCNFKCTMCVVSDWPKGKRASDMP